MVVFPHSKINLGLNVLRKREDGYHDIDTCFYPVPLTDILEIIPSDEFHFSSSGISVAGDVKDNLCFKAFQLIKERFQIGNVRMHLHKIIPMGAGLGGGSSDGAFTLRVLNQLFRLGLPVERLKELARLLGSDCSFFVQDIPQIGTGRGDDLVAVEVSLAGKFLVLIKPPVHVSTPDAYRGVVPKLPMENLTAHLKSPVLAWREKVINDFEATVFKKFPQIGSVKETLYNAGALYSSMSGSGATVYGIFDRPIDLRSSIPAEYFYWSTTLNQ